MLDLKYQLAMLRKQVVSESKERHGSGGRVAKMTANKPAPTTSTHQRNVSWCGAAGHRSRSQIKCRLLPVGWGNKTLQVGLRISENPF